MQYHRSSPNTKLFFLLKDFPSIVRPLIQLTKKDIPFSWDEECDLAFNKRKQCITGPDFMVFPMRDQEFMLDTGASNYSIRVVLSQIQNGQEKVILYAGRTMNMIETNYYR